LAVSHSSKPPTLSVVSNYGCNYQYPAIATLAAQIFVAVSLLGWLFNLKWEKMCSWVERHRLLMAFADSAGRHARQSLFF